MAEPLREVHGVLENGEVNLSHSNGRLAKSHVMANCADPLLKEHEIWGVGILDYKKASFLAF